MEFIELLPKLTEAAETRDYKNYVFVQNTFANLKKIYLGVTTLNEGEIVYRARVHELQDVPFFTSPGQLSYRKDWYRINKFGRAHLPFNSMFYCSISSKEVAGHVVSLYETIRESELRNRFYITIGAWKVAKSINVGNIFTPSDFLKYSPDNMYSYSEQLKIISKINDAEAREKAQVFNRFISNEFSKKVSGTEDHRYLNSAYFSNLICTKTNLGGILYPSQKVEGAAYNMALKPQVVEKHLSLCGAIRLEGTQEGNQKSVFKIVSKMICFNGNDEIVWFDKSHRLLDSLNLST